jgi:acetyl-CoA C-acetyltransferase
MAEAYIVDAVRTPVGRRGGALSQIHSADLGAHSLPALIDKTGIDPAAVDDIVFDCCDLLDSQAGDIARTCWLVAGLPIHFPRVAADRQCDSGQQSRSCASPHE